MYSGTKARHSTETAIKTEAKLTNCGSEAACLVFIEKYIEIEIEKYMLNKSTQIYFIFPYLALPFRKTL